MTPSALQRMMRLAGTLGILSVVVFVVGVPLNGGNVIATGVTIPDLEILETVYANDALYQIGNSATNLAAPLLFIFVLQAYRAWMQSAGNVLTDWTYTVGILGIGLWLMSGVVIVMILPAVPYFSNDLGFTENQIIGLVVSLASGLLDGAYLLLSIAFIPLGWFLRRYNRPVSRQAVFIGVSIIPIILLGPFEDVNVFGVYAYGAPVAAFFGLAVALLLRADKIAGTTPAI